MDNTKKLYKDGVEEFLDLMKDNLFTSDYFNHKMDLVTLKEAIVKYPEMVVELINDSINELDKDMEKCGICTNCGGDVKCIESGYKNYFECESCGCIFEE